MPRPIRITMPAGQWQGTHRIKAKGEIRTHYHHISDIAPTILEACKLEVPESYHGIKQQPMDGKSMMYSFNDAAAPNAKKRQYY